MVIFDMAGTTVSDKGNVADAFIEAFLSHQMDIPASEVHKVMGYRKVDAIRILLEKFYPEKESEYPHLIPSIHQYFEKSMVAFYMNDPDLCPLPGSELLFSQLRDKGVKTALNTGFTRTITDAILSRLDWINPSPVDAVICSDEVAEGRPSPLMVQELMRVCGISNPADVVKVGDTEVDVLEGRNAQCGMVISVTTGAYSRDELQLYKPDFIIDHLDNILPLISSY